MDDMDRVRIVTALRLNAADIMTASKSRKYSGPRFKELRIQLRAEAEQLRLLADRIQAGKE